MLVMTQTSNPWLAANYYFTHGKRVDPLWIKSKVSSSLYWYTVLRKKVALMF